MEKSLEREENEISLVGSKDVEEIQTNQTLSQSETSLSNFDGNVKKSRGVIRMEAINDMLRKAGKRGKAAWIIIASVWVLLWALCLEKSTTSNYEVYATSAYGRHTMIATLGIASNIISAIGQMFFAKLSDITSRPMSFIISFFLFIIGYILIPAGTTISSYVIGVVFGALGSSILDLTTQFVIGDLTPLKWRGVGIAFIETPLIIIPWFSGLIAAALIPNDWKWGYGMFCIIVPVGLIPIVTCLLYYERKVEKDGVVKSKLEKEGIQIDEDNVWMKIFNILNEFDVMGLLLLGFSISLILLPFSLYKTAEDSWRNPSIIAMFVVGGILLISFIVFEIYIAPYPCLHKSAFNRTVITEILFNLFYFMATKIATTYLSSLMLIYKDWDTRDWSYFNNTANVGKSVFGLLAGVIHRVTRRYKYLQLFGICVNIIGVGLLVSVTDTTTSTATFVMSQVLHGIAGGFAVFSSRLAIQVAVSHQNMTMGMTVVYLFTSIGKSLGSAVAAAIWNAKTPGNLRKYMPDSVSDEQVADFFGDLAQLRDYPIGSPIRTAAINAYVDTVYYLFRSALGILFISLIVCFFQKNFYLGEGQNAVEPGENNDPRGDDHLDFVEKLQLKFTKRRTVEV